MERCPFCKRELAEQDLLLSSCPYCPPRIEDGADPASFAHSSAEVTLDMGDALETLQSLSGSVSELDKHVALESDTLETKDPYDPTSPVSNPGILEKPDDNTVGPRQRQPYPGFQTKGEIGRGGFGAVLLARDEVGRRDIALKTFTPERKWDSTDGLRERFLDEAYITAQLQHPGIIPIYTIAKDIEGRYFYTMRPVEGESLHQLLRKLKKGDQRTARDFPLRRLIQIMVSVCQTIRFAHERGVIHRDLKPGNIIVGEYGEVLVIDWGLAKVIGNTERPVKAARKGQTQGSIWDQYQRSITSLRSGDEFTFDHTVDGEIMGTPVYMSPEQVRGIVEDIEFQSDIWALGVILYECATLLLPFKPIGDMGMLLTSILRDRPVDPTAANSEHRVPPELSMLIMNCLEKERRKRTSNLSELIHGLELWLEGIAPWETVVDLNFGRHADGPVEGMVSTSGIWGVRDGLLEGADDSWLLIPSDKNGDVRIEMEALVLPGQHGFMVAQICAPAPDSGDLPYQGYMFGYFPAERHYVTLYKNGKEVQSNEISGPVSTFQVIIAERVGTTLRLLMDGVECLRYRDFFPLTGPRHGIYNQGEGLRVKNLRILNRGANIRISCLDLPKAFADRKQLNEAVSLYTQISVDHPGREEGIEAMFQAGLCKLELAGKMDRENERQHFKSILGEASELFDNVEKSFLAPLGVLGRSLVYELEEKHELEIDELLRAVRDYAFHDTLPVIIERLGIRRFVYPDTGEAHQILQAAVERVLETYGPDTIPAQPLKRLPVKGLTLSEGVSRIDGLRGLELDHLDLSQTGVLDLSPLTEMEVKELILPATVTDISPLSEMKLTVLDLSQTKVPDLTALRNSSLATLILPATVGDIGLLEGLQLHFLDLSLTNVKDLTTLRSIPLELVRLPAGVKKLTGLESAGVEFVAIPAGVTDLSGLQDARLRALDLSKSAVIDLQPLLGMELEYINLPPGVRDISPLAGMPLKTLNLFQTGVTDLRPLRSLQRLESLSICPPELEQGWEEIIRCLPGLKILTADPWLTPLTQDEFWEMLHLSGSSSERQDYILAGQQRCSFINGLGSRFRFIEPGSFMMGSPLPEQGRRGDESQHQVILSRGFYLGIYPVTRAEFTRFVRETDYQTMAEREGWAYGPRDGSWNRVDGLNWSSPGFSLTPDHPVTCISWLDAIEFCRWLSKKEAETYRLPTECEWEYACRAGNTGPFAGSLELLGWFKENCDQKPQICGQKQANDFGVFDMHGNVWEWCLDWLDDYPTGSVIDPAGPRSGSHRVLRGGSAFYSPRSCRSAFRSGDSPGYRDNYLGFRIVRERRVLESDK